MREKVYSINTMHKLQDFPIKKVFTKSIREITVELHPLWMRKWYLQNAEAHWDKEMDEKVTNECLEKECLLQQ